jgi:hypothetical protein
MSGLPASEARSGSGQSLGNATPASIAALSADNRGSMSAFGSSLNEANFGSANKLCESQSAGGSCFDALRRSFSKKLPVNAGPAL